MKKRIIFVLITLLTVSFASTGSTAPKFIKNAKEKISGKNEKKKAPAAIASEVNTLLGTWNSRNRGTTVEITFTADKAVVSIDDGNGGDTFVMDMKYKFSKSPLILEYKIKNKAYKLKMDYKIEEGALTYSFPNQKNKPVPGFPMQFSQCQEGNGEDGEIKILDCPTYAEKASKETQSE